MSYDQTNQRGNKKSKKHGRSTTLPKRTGRKSQSEQYVILPLTSTHSCPEEQRDVDLSDALGRLLQPVQHEDAGTIEDNSKVAGEGTPPLGGDQGIDTAGHGLEASALLDQECYTESGNAKEEHGHNCHKKVEVKSADRINTIEPSEKHSVIATPKQVVMVNEESPAPNEPTMAQSSAHALGATPKAKAKAKAKAKTHRKTVTPVAASEKKGRNNAMVRKCNAPKAKAAKAKPKDAKTPKANTAKAPTTKHTSRPRVTDPVLKKLHSATPLHTWKCVSFTGFIHWA